MLVRMDGQRTESGGLKPASISIQIPTGNLICSPSDLVLRLRRIGDQTSTHVQFEVGPYHVRYRISGNWRDCYSAARLVWYRLTRRFTTHIHGSWLPVLRRSDAGCQSLANLYPVSISQSADADILSLTGAYWDVMKLRRELVIRQRRGVGQTRTGGLLVAGHASHPGDRLIQANRLLTMIHQDMDATRRATSAGGLNSLEMLQLLFGRMTFTSQGQGSLSTGHQPPDSTPLSCQSFELMNSSASSSICHSEEAMDSQSSGTSTELDLINFPFLGN